MNGGIYTRGEPTANHQFRDNTARLINMLNVDLQPMLSQCHFCGKRRNTATGKFTASGRFKCHGCGKAK